MFPQSHQEIARARHADFIREATEERLGRIAQAGAPDEAARERAAVPRWAAAVVWRAISRRAQAHAA